MLNLQIRAHAPAGGWKGSNRDSLLLLYRLLISLIAREQLWCLYAEIMLNLQIRAHAPAGGWKGSDRDSLLLLIACS